MTLEEFKKNYPDVANAYKNEIMASTEGIQQTAAVESERERIKAIDEMTLPGYENLANQAKYEKPITAEAFAMQIVAEQKKLGTTFLNNREEDIKNSNMNNVTPIPNKGHHSDEEDPYGDIIDKLYPEAE